MRLILASRSEARRRILSDFGYIFDVIPADIDEKAIRSHKPKRLVRDLAHAKTSAVLARIPVEERHGVMIASDQVVACRGEILEKPENEEDAYRILDVCRCFPVETVTSVVVTDIPSSTRLEGVDVVEVIFAHFSDSVVFEYIATGDPFNHAGGFDHNHPLLKDYCTIKGESESVSGLPIEMTQRFLRVHGIVPVNANYK